MLLVRNLSSISRKVECRLSVVAKQYDLWNSGQIDHLMNKMLDDWPVSAIKNKGRIIPPPAMGNGVFQKKMSSPVMQQIMEAIDSAMLIPPKNSIRDELHRKHVPKQNIADQ